MTCTPDFGDCGCDNCQGSLFDIATRMDEFAARRVAEGWARTKALWTVPQGFGASEYWSRVPTGREFVVEKKVKEMEERKSEAQKAIAQAQSGKKDEPSATVPISA